MRVLDHTIFVPVAKDTAAAAQAGLFKPILQAVMILFAAASLLVTVLGFYHQDWYGGFGLVLFMTSLICNFGVYYGLETRNDLIT